MDIKISYRKLLMRFFVFFVLTASFLILFIYPTLLNSITASLSNDPSMDSEKTPLKLIFIWNNPERIESGAAFGAGQQAFVDAGCPVINCFIQTNSSKFWRQAIKNDHEILKLFDAVLINVHRLYESFLPSYKRPAGQRLVWLTQESPINSAGIVDENPGKFERIFNWTMSYKRDSDIWLPYGRIYPISNRIENETELREERRAVLVNKTGNPIAWMISHCKTSSHRDEYVTELRKYIQLDVYGKCGGTMSCPRNKLSWISEPECYEMIGRKYKFYLSFENSFCQDYVTEKFFSILELDVVPIVFGAADYASIAPNHSYINALDFNSPAKLAEYLHLLDDDDELYLDYLEWKSHYRVEAGMKKMARHAFCDLCAKLNREDEPVKVYDSMMPSWSVSTQCNKSGWTP